MLALSSAAYSDIGQLCADIPRMETLRIANARDVSNVTRSVDAFVADVVGEANTIVVVVRGTESWRDICDDLSVCKSSKADTSCLTRVHCGFLSQAYSLLDSVYTSLQGALERAGGKAITVYMTGHSLGGAVVTLLSYMLHELKELASFDVPVHLQVYTFGSPRCGNFFFREAFDALPLTECMRYTTDTDIVSCMPCINYWHVGTRHMLRAHISKCRFISFHAHKLSTYAIAMSKADAPSRLDESKDTS
jgi:predicted lipase